MRKESKGYIVQIIDGLPRRKEEEKVVITSKICSTYEQAETLGLDYLNSGYWIRIVDVRTKEILLSDKIVHFFL